MEKDGQGKFRRQIKLPEEPAALNIPGRKIPVIIKAAFTYGLNAGMFI